MSKLTITTKGALFTENRANRLTLFREWDNKKPSIAFIGLNPSTANETDNDPTINKVIKIAAHNGYGSVYMLNLFPCVTSDPCEIVDNVADQAMNLMWIRGTITDSCSGNVVFCWGNFKQAIPRAIIIKKLFTNALCITQNKNGSPKHPLYCKDDSKFIPFNYAL